LSYINTIIWWPGNNPDQGLQTLTQAPNNGKEVACLKTNGKLNIFCLGGGPTVWSSSNLSGFQHYIDVIKTVGFQGIGFDLEQGTANYADFAKVFKQIKDAGLLVYVTTSWCKGIGSDQKGFMTKLLQSSTVDILSMQFYAGGTKCLTAKFQGGQAQSVDKCTTLYGTVSAKPKMAMSMASLHACTKSFEDIWTEEYLKDANTKPFTKDGFVVWMSEGGKDLPQICS